MTTRSSTYPLRLPASLKAAVEKLSRRDGTSINQFVVVAVAEKIAAMTTEELFAGAPGTGGFGRVRPDHEPRGRRAAGGRGRVAGGPGAAPAVGEVRR